MGPFRRKHAILIAAAGLIASTAALIGLRIGRPVYYSDGNRAFSAAELRHASMLRWGAPQPEFALPGPVRGRVAQLPDGKLLYGRVRSPRRTDLVLFDPKSPAREPEPVLVLDSPGHDLSPAVTNEDGCTIWFASDRTSGAGGFDLYRAHYREGSFHGVAPLDLPGVNTVFDETDPAPDLAHDELVFVRREPGRNTGRSNATLWIASLAGGFEPRTLFDPDAGTRRPVPALDRDPTFDPSGKALYFVRQRPLEEPVLLQTFRHRDQFVKPLPVEILTTAAGMRGPAVLAGGFDLRLVHSGTGEALTYRSRAREVRPYWDGQRWIESLLVSLSLFFLTLLVLLTLGARWHHLDLITKLFLVSVVIHLLLLLWLSRMEIVRSFLPDQPQPGQLEVTILAASQGDRTPGTEEVVAQRENISRQLDFNPQESALDATAPEVEVRREERQREPALPATPARTELQPALATEAQQVAEPASTMAARAGRSRDVKVSPTRIAKASPASLQKLTARRQQPDRRIEVTAPGSDIPTTKGQRGHRSVPDTSSLTARAPLLRPSQQGPETKALHDAPRREQPRSGTAQVSEKIMPVAGRIKTPGTPAVAIQREEGPTLDLDARPSGSLVARNKGGASLPTVKPRATTPVAEARNIQPGNLPLQDSLRGATVDDTTTRPKARPGTRSAPATAPLAKAVFPKLGPRHTTMPLKRQHPDRHIAVTGGLRIPGSFLERVTRRPQLPGSSSALAALDASLFKNRFGPQKEAALKKYGGGEDTERAVRLGLEYLAGIQNRDGSWGRRNKHNKYGRVQVGKTALCLLAFLGAGHTHKSRSKYQQVARKALGFLLRVQDDATGHFGATSSYSHGIATYALAECYAMTRDQELQTPLEYAVTWTLVNQNHSKDRRNRGGWGYFSPSLRPEDSYARASTTAWQVMALQSAKLSGIKVAQAHLRLAEQFLWRCYDRRNRYFLYTHKPSRLRTSWRTLPASTPASCFCLLLLGNDPEDERLKAGLEYTVERRPRRYARASNDQFVRRAAGNVYFWYYGSLAAFLAGGDDWRTWNRALKRVLLRGQSEDGSFKPIDVYSEYAGDSERDRSYTTAMCVLSLEVYYRYFTPLLKQR